MSIGEKLRSILKKKPVHEVDKIKEEPSTMSMIINDFTDPVRAEKQGLAPGYYIEVTPISKTDLLNKDLLHLISLPIMSAMQEGGLLPRSDVQIPVKEGMYVDPAGGLMLAIIGYHSKTETLLVRGTVPNQDMAQGLLAQALSHKRFGV